jgi:hypothetical protein
MAGLTLYDFRDLDLMMRLEDEGDEEGWAETEALARALGLSDNGGPRHVGSRFAWMRRYGMIERHEQTKMWRLTEGGRRVIQAKVRAATSLEIEALEDEAFVDVMAKVGQRYRHGSPMLAHMLRREFLYGTAPR